LNDLAKASPHESALPEALIDLLARVSRPGRYVGGEFNARHKVDGHPRVVLSYPDVYEIGISNPGLQILHTQLNDQSAAVCERAFCPWPDMATAMRAAGQRLWTLESYTEVGESDLWGFTLPHELNYTNILEMLDLAAVPLHAAERGERDPIVLGGGPGTANPLPLARFFDAFFIGEVEERLGAIVVAMAASTRAQRLQALAAVPGIWIPGAAQPAQRQVFMGFSRSMPVTEPLVSVLEAVHDRAVIEVMRGCTAGCRFCQAGMWYRPVRERPVDLVVEAAERTLAATGCDEVSLMSLSSCDYSGIEAAVTAIRALRPGLRVSLPSLRIESAAVQLARLGSEQRGSVTLAPEAGTQELRNALNKGVDDENFDQAVRATFASGFTGLKLYFMIGLPGEDEAAVGAIAAMAARAAAIAKRIARGRARLSLAVSSYVPKADTPFQWERFAGETVLRERQSLLRAAMPRGVRVSFHDVGASVVEAALARGDGDTGDLIEAAWRHGARFDGWTEHFRVDAWRAAASELGHDLDELAGRQPAARVPWDAAVDARLDAAFISGERGKAASRLSTVDCRTGACSVCGVCADEIAMDVLA
jgi:radical SAM superfamily enzyme YgiQ (UPF0313 family)